MVIVCLVARDGGFIISKLLSDDKDELRTYPYCLWVTTLVSLSLSGCV